MFKKLNLLSKTEMKVLLFVSARDGEFYERQAAKSAKVSVGSANAILKAFESLGIVKREKKGRMLFYARNDSNPLLRQFKVFNTINGLMPVLEGIFKFSSRVVLFGSCVEGLNNEKSDIDLFVLSVQKEAVKHVLDKFTKIQAVILNPAEFAELQKKDKPLFGRINQGIELHGEVF